MNLTPRELFLVLIGATYVVGSIPFGLIVGRLKGIDVRKAGSGNIGATNVGRLLGKRYFWVVFVLDLLKSLVPMLVGTKLAEKSPQDPMTYILWLMVGFAAIIGHMYSIFLRFKGGKGVATSAGVMVGLWPYYTFASFVAISCFIVALYTTRYMSIASMTGAATFPIAYLIIALERGWDPLGNQLPLLVFGVVMGALVIYKHRGNIARLRAGTESRVGRKSEFRNPKSESNPNDE